MEEHLPKCLWIIVTFFLISMMLFHVSGLRQSYAASDGVPITTGPIVTFDLYTQKGGIGPGTHGGDFELGEKVILYVKMTNNGLPVENVKILFVIEGSPQSIQLTAATNATGIASQSFTIQPVGNENAASIGIWTVTAQTGTDYNTYGDTLNLQVGSDPSSMVPEFPVSTLIMLLLILVSSAVLVYRRFQLRRRLPTFFMNNSKA